ncbi:MAG TPA: nitroreductase family protein, partial [Pseudomonadales bacterium]|nr:nitroreductase family protein [Pseudomonadales bacterium]
VLSGEALTEFSDVLATSARDSGRNVEAARRLPDQAPAIITVIDRAGQDHHVSAADEHYAVGAAMQNLLLAAHDAGLGAMIRTGVHVRSPDVRDHLGVKPDEQIAGFIYLGNVPDDHVVRTPKRTAAAELTQWRGGVRDTGSRAPEGGA